MRERSNGFVRAAGRLFFLFGCALVAAQSRAAAPAAAASPSRPNVLVILADDLGYADIGIQGQLTDVRTPNIDTIAKSGVRFTQGYVSCPVCSPTRAGFLTGRYQERFGHEFNPGEGMQTDFGLPKDQITIADQMRKAGYATGIIGKWHEGNRVGYWPLDRGFDEFFGFLGGAHNYLNNSAPNGARGIIRGNTPVGEREYLTDAIGREAVSFIDRHKQQPFFLYVPFNAVHNPQQAPKRYMDRFPDEVNENRHYLLAKLSALDDAVGQILDAVRKDGLEENTLIFFFSDNGGPTVMNGSRNKPYSGYKGQVWEGGIHEPFMAQWKGRIPPGRVLDQPVISLDIYSTACAVADIAVPGDRTIDGVNILPLMQGQTADRPHEVLYWRFSPQWAIRDGDYKMVHFGEIMEKLFDLSKDPGEKHDLMAEQPEVAKKLKSEFAKWDAELMAPRWGNKAHFARTLERDAKQLPPRPNAGGGVNPDEEGE